MKPKRELKTGRGRLHERVRPLPETGWAWTIATNKGTELCYWLRKTRRELVSEGKPSPESQAVKVEIKAV